MSKYQFNAIIFFMVLSTHSALVKQSTLSAILDWLLLAMFVFNFYKAQHENT